MLFVQLMDNPQRYPARASSRESEITFSAKTSYLIDTYFESVQNPQ